MEICHKLIFKLVNLCYTVEPLYRGHHWNQLAVLYREVPLIQR